MKRLKAQFYRFEDYASSVLDHAGLDLEICTPLGWYMQCPPIINPRTVRNFPFQSMGSEILHVLCILGEQRSLGIIAPIHDAIMAEGRLADAKDHVQALETLMGDASAVMLQGYRLPSDCKIIRPGEHYEDDRGKGMWDTIVKLLAKLERGVA
jgi:hypothetical protein